MVIVLLRPTNAQDHRAHAKMTFHFDNHRCGLRWIDLFGLIVGVLLVSENDGSIDNHSSSIATVGERGTAKCK
jgi:hypothetical protein